MAVIDEEHLHRLQSSGLHVSKVFPVGHPWAGGVRVAKPKSVGGNKIENYSTKCDGLELNAPPMVFCPDGDKYDVFTEECVPQGPCDIDNKWLTAEEAVDDILDFFFGNPQRMKIIEDY